MKIGDFEAMVARARYRLSKVYAREGDSEQRIYTRKAGGPRINVKVVAGEIDELVAAMTEALLDEEKLFEDPKDPDPEGG